MQAHQYLSIEVPAYTMCMSIGICACIAEALLELCQTNEVWIGNSPDERLRQAHIEFTRLCKVHKIRYLPCMYHGQMHACKPYNIAWIIFEFQIQGNRGVLFSTKLDIKITKRFAHILLQNSNLTSRPIRKQLISPGTFPTLAQKHFNASDCTSVCFVQWHCYSSMHACACTFVVHQESVMLARYLMGITSAVAQAHPEDEHAQSLA